MQIIHMDVFHIDNHRFLTKILDKFSRFGSVQIIKYQGFNPQEIFNIFRQFISIHGSPDKLVVDNGNEFRHEDFKQLCALHKVKMHFTTEYHGIRYIY